MARRALSLAAMAGSRSAARTGRIAGLGAAAGPRRWARGIGHGRTTRAPWGELLQRFIPFGSGSDTVCAPLGDLESKYQTVEEIGSGRFGVVRAVRPVDSPEAPLLACKSIPKDNMEAEELRNEVDMLRRLQHPHIMKLTDLVEDEEELHIITPLYSGGELFERIIERGSFSERDAAVMLRQVLLALEYMHGQQVMHRDLKPENLLFQSKEEDAPLVLIDLGMAHSFTPDTFLQSSCGSPSYVAPEVLDRNYTEKCDMWSAGVILYILLCGKVPFWGRTDDDIMRSVSLAKYNFSDPAWTHVTESAKDLVRKLLHVSPFARLSASEALAHPWIQQLGEGRNEPLRLAVSNMRVFLHHDKIKKLTLRIIARKLASSSREEKDMHMLRLREMFLALDSDDKGQIEAEDLARAILAEANQVNAFNVPGTAEDLARVLREADTDRDGTIDLEEFTAATLTESVYLKEAHLRHAFQTFDLDGNGTITLDELRAAFGPCAPRSLEEEFAAVDQNQDGEISYEEFVEHMRKSKSTL